MNSIEDTLSTAKQQLEQAGLVDSPKLDAELLLCYALDVNRSYLFTWPEKQLTPEQLDRFDAALQQRLAGQPIAHIIGQREFWGLELSVTADTLIPRPDTETLIEATLDLLNTSANQACSILDLGTGTGAIALALKSELPHCQLTALDQSDAALEVAKSNAEKLNLQVNFLHSDWFSAVSAKQFSCIVSNPPYIEENDPHLSQGDVRFEPISALTSGKDGLDDIRLIIDQAWSYLQNDGWLIIEHGYNQAQPIAELLQAKGYQNLQMKCDLAGNPRISIGQKTTA